MNRLVGFLVLCASEKKAVGFVVSVCELKHQVIKTQDFGNLAVSQLELAVEGILGMGMHANTN